MLDGAGDDCLAPPTGGALVRVHADDGSWVHRLPTVPRGCTITVSTATAAQREVGAADLLHSGYRITGRQPSSRLPAAVELLVNADMMAAEPAWWRQLLTVADRAFDLRLGPVQAVMGSHLRAHQNG